MKIFKFKKLNKKRGFTLVETLVSLFIFTASLLGIVALSADNIVNISYAKNKLTATYLAVEGLEYVRNARDNFILFGTPWEEFVDKSDFIKCIETSNIDGNEACYFDVEDGIFPNSDNTGKINSCNQGTCPYFSINNDGVYFYEEDPYANYNTTFKRTVTAVSITEGIKELKVTSEVSWEKNGKTNTVSFVDYLRNWAEPTAGP